MRSIMISLVFLVAASPALASHDKTDVVTTDDGSSYVGEIKGAQSAALSLKTNAASTISIEWRYITTIVSKYQYRIESAGGILRYGSLAVADKPGQLRIVGSTGPADLDLVDIVEILPIESTLKGRIDGSVNFGLTYTQANSSLQYNLSADASYRSRKNIASLTAQSILISQEAADTTDQHYLTFVLSQVIKASWGAFEVGQLQSNPDQGYDLRTVLGGGAVHFFKENSRVLINANMGLVYNREVVTDSDDVDKTMEFLLGVSYREFKHSSHSPTIRLGLNTFTDLGVSRYRFTFTSEIKWKIVGDLTIDVQLNNNYDSDPPGEDSNNNNFTFVTSVGYTF